MIKKVQRRGREGGWKEGSAIAFLELYLETILNLLKTRKFKNLMYLLQRKRSN